MKQESQNKSQNKQQDKSQAPPPPPAKKKMVCPEYPSIQMAQHQVYMKMIHDENFDKQDITWVATQKINGINFSIHCLGEHIRYGRRFGFTTQNIQLSCKDAGAYIKQPYYDVRKLINKYHEKLIYIKQNLLKLFPLMKKFSIFGQYFGGLFPGIQTTSKHIQLGNYYVPNYQFIAFDILIINQKQQQSWLDFSDFQKVFVNHIPYVATLAKGTFKEMLQFNTKIDSTIPQRYKLQKLKNNLIEGIVIRPLKSLKLSDGDRVILKIRNDKQIAQAALGKPHPKQLALDGDIAGFVSCLQIYLNKQKIIQILKKYPQCKNNQTKLKNEIIRDIRFIANKNQYREAQGQQLIKKVNDQFEKRVILAIEEYYKK